MTEIGLLVVGHSVATVHTEQSPACLGSGPEMEETDGNMLLENIAKGTCDKKKLKKTK